MTNSVKNYLIAIFILIALTACERTWYLTIVGNGGVNPILNFSPTQFDIDKGVQFSSLEISEVNENGERIQTVWLIHGKSNRPEDYVLKSLTYGVLPSGWVEDQAAKPIVSGKYYEVEGEFYFIKETEGKYQVFSRAEFFGVNRKHD